MRQRNPTEKTDLRRDSTELLNHSIQFLSSFPYFHFNMPSLLFSNFFLTTHFHKHPHFYLNFSGFHPTRTITRHPPRTSISCSAHRFFIFHCRCLLSSIISILILAFLCRGWVIVPGFWFHCKLHFWVLGLVISSYINFAM